MPASEPKTQDSIGTQPSGLAGEGLPLTVGTVVAQAWMDIGSEAVRFVWDRLQQDIKTQTAMLACKNVEDLQKLQAEFFAAAQEQYAAEAGKMLALVGKATVAGLKTSAKARRYDDVPL